MGLLKGTESEYYSSSDLGNYQFISLEDVITQFLIGYVGENKLIPRISRTDVAFHAQRTLAELSFDTLKSIKAQEITVGATLSTPIPRDYVNYVKLTWSDSSGIEHVLTPMPKTSNPTKFDGSAEVSGDSVTMTNYKSDQPVENSNFDYDYDDNIYSLNEGRRYGLDPQYANVNGHFFIDELKGNVHFSSNLSGSTVILKYISDSLGTDGEMQVHKLAEEAMYKLMAYAILSTRSNMPEYVVRRFKKEASAARRQAKLRLSNIKIEEITQVLRGQSKQIKH